MAGEHRDLATIDTDINTMKLRLILLHDERRAAIQGRSDAVCRLFTRGMDVEDIAIHMRLKPEAVRGLLWRAGHTRRGRRRVKAAIAEYVS